MLKYLEGVVVTELSTERKQIAFDSETGLIHEVGQLQIPREKIDFYYEDSCMVFPGFIDLHVHAREDVSGEGNYKEDFYTVGQAAVNGGVTCIGDMPNNKCPPVEEKGYYAKIALTTRSVVPVFLYAGIGANTRPLDFKVPYKLYMTKSIGDLFMNDEDLEAVLSRYHGQMISFHCEDTKIIEANRDKPTHLQRRPPEAEIVAIERLIPLIKKYNIDANICHVSTQEGMKKIIDAKRSGICIASEVTPTHLYFCHENLGSFEKKFFQMNPPVRSRQDQEAMLSYFLNGDIDFLATDHAPHTLSEKLSGISGLTGLDTYGLFVSWLLEECKISPQILVKATSHNSGKYIQKFLKNLQILSFPYKKLGEGLGEIQKNFAASFTVIDLKNKKKITKSEIKSKTKWSPFEDTTFPGCVRETLILGKEVKT